MSGLFCITNLLEERRKKVFLKNFMDFNHLQTKIKLNIFIINVKTKVFFLITMTLKLAKSEKAKKK